MPAEIDTSGPRVLHCDSRADCPTTPINESTSAGRCWAECAHLSYRRARSLADLDRDSRASPRARRIDANRESPGNPESRRGDPQRGVEIRAVAAAESSSASTSENDRKAKDFRTLNGRDVLSRSSRSPTGRTSTRRRRRGDGLTCLEEARGVPRATEHDSKDECHSVTRNCREGANARGKVERAESRLRDETEASSSSSSTSTSSSRLAIADTSGHSIARRRSLQDCFCTRPATCSLRKVPDSPERTRAAGRNPLFSSHHSHHACTKDKDRGEGLLGERLASEEDARTDEVDARSDCSRRRRDEHPEEKKRIAANRKRSACRARSFPRLAFLLFLVAFGRSGLFGSSVLKFFSAGPTVSGLSVLAIGTIIGAVSAAPLDLIGDAGIRAERSANLSHITGASRKIQMYIKNRHLQILPDGTVNGSNDDTSDYTIFQRTSVSRGQLRIQGVATCLYLCMDSCGLLYGSRDYSEDCLFNETLEQHNYNTYSSVRWSTEKKTLYLGLNRHGQPRRVQARGHNLGRLSAYARVLTQVAPPDRVEALLKRIQSSQHNVRLRHQGHAHRRGQHGRGDMAQQPICPTLPVQEKDGRDRFRCRKRKKRKKRKRRCKAGEQPGPQCQVPEEFVASPTSEATGADAPPETASTTPESKRSCEGAASEEACRRQALSVPAKKRKSRIDDLAVAVVGRNLTLNGKNKAPTSNAKKPNVDGDSQSKKPDLTDGKRRKRKGPATTRTRGSAVGTSSLPRKRYAFGTMSSRASSPRTAPASEVRASTASSSWPSPPGASTAPSVRRTASPTSGRRKPPLTSRSYVTRPVGSRRRVGKHFPDAAASPARPTSKPTPSAPTTLTSETTRRNPRPTTKVPETTASSLPASFSSSSAPSLSTEDFSRALSDSSLVDEEFEPLSSSGTSEFTSAESITSATASGEVVAELMMFGLVEEDGEDGGSGMADITPRTTTRFPFERLAM